MEWFFDLNHGNDYLAFSFVGHEYDVYYSNDVGVGDPQPITKLALSWVVTKVKEECEGVIRGLVSRLKK
jgi:hypothetical protein